MGKPNSDSLLAYTLTYYLTENSQFKQMAEPYQALLQCWAISNKNNLPACTLSFYNSEQPQS